MPFDDPASGGDKLPLNDLDGALLLFTVQEAIAEIDTSFGKTSAIRTGVAVLDGAHKGDTYDDALIFPRVLQSQLRPRVGGMVLGRLGKGQAKPGQSAPWTLSAATDAEKATGEKYLEYVKTQTAAAEAAASPF